MLKNKTFIQAYFHTVQEIEAEFVESGLIVGNSFGVLGQAWETPDLDTVILDSKKKDRLLEVAEMMEGYPMLGSKILTVGSKAMRLSDAHIDPGNQGCHVIIVWY